MSRRKKNIVKPYLNHEEYERVTNRSRRKDYAENLHHILMKSRNGSNHLDNTIKLYLDVHNAYHRVFGNMILPERIERMLDIERSAMNVEAIDLIEGKLLTKKEDLEFWYKKHCIK